MNIYDIHLEGPNADFYPKMLEKGQTVRIVQMVTISYEVAISDFLEESDETCVSVEALILDEMRNNGISVETDYQGNVDVDDNTVIEVEII